MDEPDDDEDGAEQEEAARPQRPPKKKKTVCGQEEGAPQNVDAESGAPEDGVPQKWPPPPPPTRM